MYRRYVLVLYGGFSHCFQRQVISWIQWENQKHPEDIVQVDILCLGFNSKAVEIWSVMFFSSPFGNHGDSTVSYIQSMWEGITLEMLLKNDLNIVLTHESWGGASVNILCSSEPEKPVSVWLRVLPQLLGNNTVTVECFLIIWKSCMCPGTLKWHFHHRYLLDIILIFCTI